MTEPLRLAVLNQREGGGATAHARDLIAMAEARGIRTASFPDARDRDAEALLDALRVFRPDVVHAHCFYNTWPRETLRAIADTWPVAFTLHDVYAANQYGTECWECYRNPWCYACPALPMPKRLYSVYRVRERRVRDRAWRGLRAHVIYPTEWMRRRMRRIAIAALPSTVIRYGIDATAFRPDTTARARLNLSAAPLLLSVGSMYSKDDDRKGFAYLLDAFSRVVRTAIPAARLVIVGRTFGLAMPEGATVVSEVPRNDLAAWYSAADVFALPSLGDNGPLAVLEAMSCGAPVVATAVGGIPEEVADGVTGLLVPPGDAAAVGAAIVRLLGDPATRAAMGAAGRRRVVDLYEREGAFAAHERLYRRLVEERRESTAPRVTPRSGS
jgi:glycosyltransferase involved in cell wall biosynthesis